MPKVTQGASVGGVVCIQFYLVPKPMLFTTPHTSHQDVRGSSSEGKSLSQARGRVPLREIPGPRELCRPHRAHCPVLVVRVSGHGISESAAQANMRRVGGCMQLARRGPRAACRGHA